MALLERTLLLVLGGLLLSVVDGAKKNVTIMKCCGSDETLTYDNKCLKNASVSWKLTILVNKTLNNFNRLPATWIVKESSRPPCSEPKIGDLVRKNVIPFINGRMYSVEYNDQIDADQYCIDYNYALFCHNPSPERITYVYVKKCCLEGAIFSETNSSCVGMNDKSYKIDVGQEKNLNYGFPNCEDNAIVVAGKQHESQIINNGSLWMMDRKILLNPGNYCLEHILEHAGRSPSVITCREHLPSKPNVKPTINQSENDLRFTIYPIGLAISAIFLAATLAAGSLLPASHHVLHWRCQTNHVACLLVGDVLLCITHLSGRLEFAPCFAIAVAMHFLFLSAFFWLNTMCFNIWWTFRDLRPQNTEKSQERLRLRLYEAYAWGMPFLIVFIGAISDLACIGSDCAFLRPRFAENKCWFFGDKEIFTFFFGPMGTLLIINLLLFVLTARELTCGLWKRELVKSTTERAALGRVCMKLVVVMGVTWIADVISWVVGGPQEIWYATDVINCLQGVFIFIVVGCQPQVLSAAKRAWFLQKHRQNGAADTANHHSSSSQGLPSVGDTLTNTNSVTNTTKSVPLETSC
ncbi:probable G-protein coupled receptor Mth-like 1 [Cylas formicarius]|uniref:probable G-protein coupled receptor Mth-like 1 n=1 Tax=Cylas formicarius TaxID=197179 RepID=UPI002958D995|nr:probable G-protein coupled receptor Mth-like 1 [Cylas formicarius]